MRASGTLLPKPDALAVKLDFVNWCFKPLSRGWLLVITEAVGLPGSGPGSSSPLNSV